jgi:hypothetical protein
MDRLRTALDPLRGIAGVMIAAIVVADLLKIPFGNVLLDVVFFVCVAVIILTQRQWPWNLDKRLSRRRVYVLWNLEKPRPGRVERFIGGRRGPLARVRLDGEGHAITVPLGALRFPWHVRARHWLPWRFYWARADLATRPEPPSVPAPAPLPASPGSSDQHGASPGQSDESVGAGGQSDV